MEERMSNLKDRNVEGIQVEEERKLRFKEMKKLWELFDSIRKSNIKIMGISEEEER